MTARLADYCAPYQQYRLQAVHTLFSFVSLWDDHDFALFPFVSLWGDHELANDC
ncbi:MAG: hypothetical protein HOV81_31100 [Kofleriaceae bacterium]|nr:hypothetical protein [Kofleriaceae bacterium]